MWQQLCEGAGLLREVEESLSEQSKGRGTRARPVPRKEGTVHAQTRAGTNWCVPGILTPQVWECICSSAWRHSGLFPLTCPTLELAQAPNSGVHSQVHQPQALGRNLQPCWACLPPARELSEGTGSFSKPVFTEPCAKQFSWAGYFFLN